MRLSRVLIALSVLALVACLPPAAAAEDLPPCHVGPPLYPTTHVDVSREVPLPDHGVTILAGHSNAKRINPWLAPLLPVPTINAGYGGHDSAAWANTNNDEYRAIRANLTKRHLTEADVTGWVWVATQRKTKSTKAANDPTLAARFEADMLKILTTKLTRYPNLETVWIASPEASFSVETGNLSQQEPSPYRQGTVAAQVAHDYTGPLHIVPGPYVWVDQVCPREDGLLALQSELSPDGVHPLPILAQRYAAYMAAFLVPHRVG